jgi:spore maturation protein CgeB
VAAHLATLDRAKAARIGRAGRERILASHTYSHRVLELEALLEGRSDRRTGTLAEAGQPT